MMVGTLKAFRCYRCGVDFDQERSLLRHYSSKKQKEMEDIQERVEKLQRQDCYTLPVLEEVVLPDATGRSQPLETKEDVEKQESDMEILGSEENEQSATNSVLSDVSDESSSSEEEVDMEFEYLLMNESERSYRHL